MTTLTEAEVIAVAVVDLARRGRFREVEGSFAPGLRALVSAESLRADWTGELARTGPVQTIGAPTREPGKPGLERVSVPVNCERGGLTVVMSVDRGGNLHGLRLATPAAEWEPPPYAEPKWLTEQEITLGSGALAVPGALTLPLKHGRRPAVLLLGGDDISGAANPLKDFAWGLATQGVVSVRFDHVTFAHREATAEAGFTVTDEYVSPALAAIGLLRAHYAVDPKRIFVAGSGKGGLAAPRVAAAAPALAGLVVLTGDESPEPVAAHGLPTLPLRDGRAGDADDEAAAITRIAGWLAADHRAR